MTKEKQYITFEEAIKQGYKMFFIPNHDNCRDLDRQEVDDLKGVYEEIELADLKYDSLSLNAEHIIENATDDLWEDAYDAVVQTDIFKELQALCERMNKELEMETASYHYSGVYIKL